MKELTEYRIRLIDRLAEAVHRFREACLAVNEPFAPLEAGGWTTHQVAVHTRDVDKLVYGARVRRTAAEDNPEFPNFDGDAFMEEQYDPGESLNKVLDELVENVESLAALLRQLPVEAWSRESRHATMGGGFTLQSWVERDLAHIEGHIEMVKKGK